MVDALHKTFDWPRLLDVVFIVSGFGCRFMGQTSVFHLQVFVGAGASLCSLVQFGSVSDKDSSARMHQLRDLDALSERIAPVARTLGDPLHCCVCDYPSAKNRCSLSVIQVATALHVT